MSDINQPEVERLSAAIYEELAKRLTEAIASHTGEGAFNFYQWLVIDLLDQYFPNPERKVAYLIAVTGIIHEYLENEHGVHFQPNT